MFHFLFSGHLEEGEKIMFVAHRHPFTAFVPFMKVLFFGVAAPAGLVYLFPAFIYIGAGWLFFGLLRLGFEFVDWYYDAWVLTNASVIDLQWNGIFNRSSTRIEYQTIEGVSYEFVGVMHTLFRYGNITIQKIGSGAAVSLEDVINPRKVESRVLKFQNQFVSNKSFRDHDALKDLLVDMLQNHKGK